MKILFDQGTPEPLRRHLSEYTVHWFTENGWEMLENGELIRKAEADGYSVIVTTNKNMCYQDSWADAGDCGVVVPHLAQNAPLDG